MHVNDGLDMAEAGLLLRGKAEVMHVNDGLGVDRGVAAAP